MNPITTHQDTAEGAQLVCLVGDEARGYVGAQEATLKGALTNLFHVLLVAASVLLLLGLDLLLQLLLRCQLGSLQRLQTLLAVPVGQTNRFTMLI